MKKHYRITIKGIVQGVFFRQNTLEKAESLGLSGFVENRNEDLVYIEAEGPEDSLKTLLEWCHKGPEKAVVESVEFKEGEIKGYQIFEIRRH